MNAGQFVLEHTATCYMQLETGRHRAFYGNGSDSDGIEPGIYYVDWNDRDQRVGPFSKWRAAADAAEAAGFLRPETCPTEGRLVPRPTFPRVL